MIEMLKTKCVIQPDNIEPLLYMIIDVHETLTGIKILQIYQVLYTAMKYFTYHLFLSNYHYTIESPVLGPSICAFRTFHVDGS